MVTLDLFILTWLLFIFTIIVFLEKQPGILGGARVGNLKTSLINDCIVIVGIKIALIVAIIGITAISAAVPIIGIAAITKRAAILADKAPKMIIIKFIIFKKSDFKVK